MAKPEFVYHGSNKGIEGPLLPRPQRGNINGDFPEGQKNVVFATDDQNLAAVYALKTPQMLQTGESEGKSFSILYDYDKWLEKLESSNCNVYVLPSDNFTNNLSKEGKPTKEWQSEIEAKPVLSIHYTPEKVMETGAQLFFLDTKVKPDVWQYSTNHSASGSFLNRVTEKKDSGILPKSFTMFHIARELIDAGLMTHLNAQTNIKPENLEKSPYSHLIKDDIDWLKQQTQKAWQPLKAGDSVYLIAPSSQVTNEEVKQYSQVFQEMGLNVIVPNDINKGYFHWSNTPERIVEHITEAMNNKDVKAIFSIKGGEGASEVAHILKGQMAKLKNSHNRGIPMFGYSDNGELHVTLGEAGIISPVQGVTFNYLVPPTDATQSQLNNFTKNRAALREYLMGEHTTEPAIPLIALNKAAEQTVSLNGELNVGTQNSEIHHIKSENEILILDGRKADGLALKMKQMEDSGELKNYKAVVLSRYYENGNFDGELGKANTQAIKQVIEAVPSLQSVPVFFGMPFGHPEMGMSVNPIPLNTATTITKGESGYELAASRFRDKSKLDTPIISQAHNLTEKPSNVVETQAVQVKSMRTDIIQGKEINDGAMNIVGGKIALNAAFIPDASHIDKQDIRGKNVLLHFDLDPRAIQNGEASVHAAHTALMPLIANGKLKDAASITVSADVPFAEEFKSWLKDFSAKHLPNTDVQVIKLDGKDLPKTFTGTLEAHRPSRIESALEHKPAVISVLQKIGVVLNGLNANPPNSFVERLAYNAQLKQNGKGGLGA